MDPAGDMRTWVGKTFYSELGTVSLRTLSLAGEVAVALLDEPDVEAWQIVEYLELGLLDLSTTDAHDAGGYGLDDVESAVVLVRLLWPGIEREAGRLVRAAGIDGLAGKLEG
jgi:hypothetical protein